MEKMYERALREQKEREARGGDDKDEPGSSMRNGRSVGSMCVDATRMTTIVNDVDGCRGQIYNPQTGKWSELQPAQTQGRPHSSGSAEGTPTYEVKTFPSGNRYEVRTDQHADIFKRRSDGVRAGDVAEREVPRQRRSQVCRRKKVRWRVVQWGRIVAHQYLQLLQRGASVLALCLALIILACCRSRMARVISTTQTGTSMLENTG